MPMDVIRVYLFAAPRYALTRTYLPIRETFR